MKLLLRLILQMLWHISKSPPGFLSNGPSPVTAITADSGPTADYPSRCLVGITLMSNDLAYNHPHTPGSRLTFRSITANVALSSGLPPHLSRLATATLSPSVSSLLVRCRPHEVRT